MLVFRKILRTYLIDGPLANNKFKIKIKEINIESSPQEVIWATYVKRPVRIECSCKYVFSNGFT